MVGPSYDVVSMRSAAYEGGSAPILSVQGNAVGLYKAYHGEISAQSYFRAQVAW